MILREMIARTTQDESGRLVDEQIPSFRLVNTEDGRSQEIWRAPDEWTTLRDLRWFPDGAVVALLQLRRDLHAHRAPFHLLRIRPGEGRFSPVGWETEATSVRLVVGPAPDEVVVHAQSYKRTDEQSRRGPYVEPIFERQELTAVSMDGATRDLELPPARGLLPYADRSVGLDHRGRLILLGASQRDLRSYPAFDRVDALDVATGQVTAIYP